MKKFVSLFLVMCVLVVNCMVPFAAEEIITEEDIVFYDRYGNIVKEVTLKCGEEFYFTCSYSGSSTLIWHCPTNQNVISFTNGTQAKNITALSEGESYIRVLDENYDEIGRLTVVVTAADTKTDEKDENGESETDEDSKGEDTEKGDVKDDDNKTDDGTAEDGKGDDGKGDTDEGSDGKGDGTEESDTPTVSGKIIFTDENGGEISELYLTSGVTYSLTYTLEGTRKVYFESDNSGVAEVSENCITTYSSGTAVIVAYDSNKTEIGRLTVYVSETGTDDGKGDDGKGDTDEGSDGKGDDGTAEDGKGDGTEEGGKGDGTEDDGKGDGKEDSDMPTEISFEDNSATVYVGESHTFYYSSLSPENANSDKLVWSTQNTDIIRVNNNTVTALAPGNAYVNIYNTNGDYLGDCYVRVVHRMTGISLDKTELTLKDGDYETLYATILPEGAECDGLNWSSSDTSVVSLNYTEEFKSREIYANGVGKATITVSDDKEGFSASCEVTVEPVLVESITLDQTTLEMTVGDYSRYVNATVSPYNASNRNITWSSSNEDVATVSKWGDVEAVGVGEAIITAAANDGSGVSATCNVTVKKSISLDYSSMTLYIGKSRKNYAYVNPSNEDGKDVEWSSSDSSVATVDEDGNITAISEGKAVITATAINGGGAFATCTVTVRDGAVKGISFDETTLEINIGDCKNLNATFTPDYAKNQNVTWKSSDEGVVSIWWDSWDSNTCELYGEKEGTATITATSEEGGYTATCTVTVKKIPVNGITLDKETLDLRWSDSYRLTATVSPSDASYKNVTWKSSNENVATVDSYGRVYAEGEGTATITATTKDGGYTATCTVTVTKTHVTGISLNKTETEIEVGSREALIATIIPEDADDKTVNWTSSDENVAYVYGGTVYGNKEGTVIITATTRDGEYKAECTVTVKPVKVEGITIPQQNIEVQLGRIEVITVNFTPENATNKNIIWSSDNKEVAYAYTSYVDHIVRGKALGTATITATTEDGGYTASFTVTVVPVPVTGVSVDPHLSIMGDIGKGSKLWATVSPDDATNQNVIWSSDDEDIAEVRDDSYGNKRIYAKKAGTTRIWAISEDGGYQDSCLVEVLFDMKDDDITLLKSGDSYTVTCDYNTSCLRNLKWSSSDTSVATVDENGVVTAVGKGTATIKLSGEYYGEGSGRGEEWSAACNVTVIGTSGTLIDNVTWKLEDDGTTLTIGGSGDIPEYSYGEYEYDAYKDNITKIVIGSGITDISGEPFNNFKKLEKVVISDTVTSVNFNAFSNCSGFEWEIDDENTSLCVKDGVLFSYDMKTLYSYPISKTDEKYVVPSSVESIFNYAFGSGENYKNTSLKRIVLDKNLTSIGYYAFNNCSIERIYYYGSYSEWYNVSKYNSGISDDCKIVTNYVTTSYKDGYEYYVVDGGAYVFEYVLPITEQSFTVADTLDGYPVKIIGEYAFESECITDEYGESYYNVIDELIIPKGIEKLDACAFENFYADKVVIPSTVTKIGYYALNGIGAEISVSAENANYTSVDGVLFNKDKTVLIQYPSEKEGEEYTVPSEVKTIFESAFSGCLALKKVILGNNVEEIGYYAFQYCTKLKSITIPASVSAIGSGAFYNSNNLTDVYYGGTEKRWNSIEIGDWRNAPLDNATKHYGTVEVDPVYIKEGRYDSDNHCFCYNVYLNGIDTGKTVVFAIYNDGMLINCDYKTYSGEEYIEFKSGCNWGIYDCIKAMVWDSMESMTPVCKYAVKYFQSESSTVD